MHRTERYRSKKTMGCAAIEQHPSPAPSCGKSRTTSRLRPARRKDGRQVPHRPAEVRRHRETGGCADGSPWSPGHRARSAGRRGSCRTPWTNGQNRRVPRRRGTAAPRNRRATPWPSVKAWHNREKSLGYLHQDRWPRMTKQKSPSRGAYDSDRRPPSGT